MPKFTAATADRHELYERAVQCAEADIDFAAGVFREARGRRPRLLKEDFCGTAAAAVEFVGRDAKNRAWGVDLDAETLEYGRRKHVAKLGRRAGRVRLINADVRAVTEPRVDLLLALNFSYFIFKRRDELKRYFASMHASLNAQGVAILDAYGGSGAQVPQKERRRCRGFTYIWDQHSYNPVTSEVVNHIDFKFPDGTRLRRAFSYDWRLWTLREIAELLLEVGFSAADVYWEGWDEKKRAGDGKFVKTACAENCEKWIAYVAGIK